MRVRLRPEALCDWWQSRSAQRPLVVLGVCVLVCPVVRGSLWDTSLSPESTSLCPSRRLQDIMASGSSTTPMDTESGAVGEPGEVRTC